jgi:hypothetical protein
MHQPQRNIIGRCFEIAFRDDPDDGFRITRSKMYPVVIKLDAQSIFRVYGMTFVFDSDLVENRIQVEPLLQLHFVLDDEIIRV